MSVTLCSKLIRSSNLLFYHLEHANSTQPLNTTRSSQVTVINSTENNQTLSADQKVQVEVIKLATPSAEEKLEHNLEDPDSDS
ncbi:hypothetical protein OS493_026498 [Desmophyllum pertusum]|uniref:Uncharacterized protein n=1 Tax=Desmophyllum pertusum TaxID=174260 RepID=A0A9X0CJA5_9CNID|nr:hypothetical protein OS493_026498 [Desmophyllum pertusum]